MRGFAIVVAVVMTTPSFARADDDPPAPPAAPAAPTATDLFDSGRDALAAHRAAEACDDFTRALTIDPEAAGIMLNLGLCSRDLDRLATALRWFRKAQARGSETGLAEIEASAKQQATELATRVATISFSLERLSPPQPPTQAITLDGAPTTAVDLARIELDAGRHVVEVTTPDGTSHREVDVVDGESASIELAVPHRERRVSELDRGAVQRHRARVVGELSAGVLGAVLVGGIVAHHVAADPATGVDTEARLRSAFEWGVTPVATAAFAGAALAAYWYWTAPRVERREELVPVVDGTHVGLAITTRF